MQVRMLADPTGAFTKVKPYLWYIVKSIVCDLGESTGLYFPH